MLRFALALLSAALFAIVGAARAADPPSPPLDPTRPVVEVKIPLVSIAEKRGEAFLLPDAIKIPPRGTVRVKGKFHTGKRSGGALVAADALIPSKSGKMTLLANGLKGVKMREESECEFELVMRFPKDVRPGIIEFKVGDEYFARADFGPAP